jgi:hypothetical protein
MPVYYYSDKMLLPVAYTLLVVQYWYLLVGLVLDYVAIVKIGSGVIHYLLTSAPVQVLVRLIIEISEFTSSVFQ